VVGKDGIVVAGGGRASMREEARARLDADLNDMARRIIELPTCLAKNTDILLRDLSSRGVELETGLLQTAARRFVGMGHLHLAAQTLQQLWDRDPGAVDYDMVRAMALEGVRDRLRPKAAARFIMNASTKRENTSSPQQSPSSPPQQQQPSQCPSTCAVVLLVLGRQDMKEAVLAWQQIDPELKRGPAAVLMYNAMLDGCVVHRHQMAAEAVLKEMEMFGVQPDACSYALLAQLYLRCQDAAKTAEYKAKLEAVVAASAHAQQPAASPEEGEAAEERGPPEEEELQEARGGKKKAKTGVGLQREPLVPRVLNLLHASP